MKVLQISRTMGQGGAEKVVFELCKDAGINMEVASNGGFYVEKLKSLGVAHHAIPDITSKNPFIAARTYDALKKIVEENNITVIHSHHRMAAFYAQLLKRKYRNLKLVYTAHNAFTDKKILTRFSLKNTKIIACGGNVKNNLTNIYNIPSAKIELITNSVEMPKNIKDEKLDGEKGELKIVAIGRLTEQKGFDVFIKAIKNIKDAHGYIIGDGDLLKPLKELTKSLSMENKITFLGFKENVLGYIKSSDFVVLPSRWEGFPLTPIETFACGKTIIATDIPGNNDIIEDGSNGLLFDKDNEKELTNKIILLKNDIKLRRRLENKARVDFSEKFSYYVFISKYKDVYGGLSK